MGHTLRNVLTVAAATVAVFAGIAGSFGVAFAATEKTVYVGPQRVDCEGMGPQKCYQVRERPEDPWLFFYDEIEGFSYEEGYTYQIRVEETEVPNPPADGASFTWRLLEVVSKTPASSATLPPQMLSTEWLLLTYQIARAAPRDVSSFQSTANFAADGTINGSGGCNSFSGRYQAGDNQAITISQLISTRKACEGEVMPWESTYLQSLESAREYRLENGRLEIVFANGQGTFTYAPRDGAVKPPVEPTPVVPGMPTTGAGNVTPYLLIALLALVLFSGAFLSRRSAKRS